MGVSVLAATDYLESIEAGLVAKVDMSKLTSPIIQTALLLLGVSPG